MKNTVVFHWKFSNAMSDVINLGGRIERHTGKLAVATLLQSRATERLFSSLRNSVARCVRYLRYRGLNKVRDYRVETRSKSWRARLIVH